jgi:hypothetical protein
MYLQFERLTALRTDITLRAAFSTPNLTSPLVITHTDVTLQDAHFRGKIGGMGGTIFRAITCHISSLEPNAPYIIYCYTGSTVNLTRCTIDSSADQGIMIESNGKVVVRESIFSNVGSTNVLAMKYGNFDADNCCFSESLKFGI